MLSGFWDRPLFWVGLFFVGLVITLIVYRLPAAKEKSLRMPKIVQRLFALTFYLLPPFVLPLLPQPRLRWPLVAAVGAALAFFVVAIGLRARAQRVLGAHPALRARSNLVTTGIYSHVRHPMYLSNLLLTAGWGFLFRGIHALFCVPAWALGYAVLLLFEEKGLEEEYGDEYREYRRKVRYRFLPYLW